MFLNPSKILYALPLALLASCAATYHEATRSTYLGNNQYEITVQGNEYTTSSTVRDYLRRRAFRTCASQGQGFTVIASQNLDRTSTTVETNVDGTEVSTRVSPGARMIIACGGYIDHSLEAEVLRQERAER